MNRAPNPPPLLYTATRPGADGYYFGKIVAGDPFIAFEAHGRKVCAVSPLEFGRFLKTSDFDVVLPLQRYTKQAEKLWKGRKVGPAEVICLLAKKYGIARFSVGFDFPAKVYRRLLGLGIALDVANGWLFPEREMKSPAELRAIRDANRASAAGIAAAERTLRSSRIKGGRLYFRGEVLTSERVKLEIETACLKAGARSVDTIVAGGIHALFPHDTGAGPLHPNELIIVDVFPQSLTTGYHGDMTRTFLRGRARESQRALVASVRKAQVAAIAAIRTGAAAREAHQAAVRVYKFLGYETDPGPTGRFGFRHGLGHGLGLDVHEPPRMSSFSDAILKRNSVVTIEPGLYYRGIGGCRIEDVVQVTDKGARLLSDYPLNWEL